VVEVWAAIGLLSTLVGLGESGIMGFQPIGALYKVHHLQSVNAAQSSLLDELQPWLDIRASIKASHMTGKYTLRGGCVSHSNQLFVPTTFLSQPLESVLHANEHMDDRCGCNFDFVAYTQSSVACLVEFWHELQLDRLLIIENRIVTR
jgi:hypothetical protein